MHLTKKEKSTFKYLLIGSILYGFMMSSFKVQDIIAKKAFNAFDWQITIIVMIWPLSNLISIWWGKLLEHSRSLSKYFLLTGIVGRLSLVLMLWVTNYYQFLSLIILMFVFNALMSPASNSILQNSFNAKDRGKVFGYLASLTTLASVIASFLAGKLLSADESMYRVFFSVVGIIGFLQAILMMQIKIKKSHIPEKAFLSLKDIVYKPIIRSMEVLKKNKNFAIFQKNFFIYGIGFMMLLPTLPKYLIEILEMDYNQSFLAKGIIAQIGVFVLAPLAGKHFSKKNPAFFIFIFFLLISLFPTVLLISSFFIGTSFANYLVYLAFFIFSIAMSGIVISWSMSSISFAGSEDVSMYQSVHVTLTGVRALIGPFMGLLIMKTLGLQAVFGVAIILFILASYLSFRLHLKMNYLQKVSK